MSKIKNSIVGVGAGIMAAIKAAIHSVITHKYLPHFLGVSHEAMVAIAVQEHISTIIMVGAIILAFIFAIAAASLVGKV